MGALTELPPELLVGWALWVIGGLLLTAWFLRRSASPRTRELAPPLPQGGGARVSSTHAVAGRNPSGTPGATGRSSSGSPAAAKAPSVVHPPDAFDELRALLDRPEDPPRP